MNIPAWPVVLSIIFLWWTQRAPRFDWAPKAPEVYPKCPKDTTSQTLLFGGTSMLGRYIVDTWTSGDKGNCLINYGRKVCPKCDISIQGDVRDAAHIKRVFEHYNIDTVVTSIKPALEGTHWREFMEINVAATIEITKLAKAAGVQNFIHVSSIAASSHYKPAFMEDENSPQPLYTEYEAAYDLSKRLGEDFVLGSHEEGKFNTIALRVSRR
uniref:NAD-dependent epimerase/dehydratase domain-containing protein n=1 Tax=Aplanochytrium stocchinoi TaxID=215587 RepID=A0A7S3LQX3_9STRA